ncbi:ABC transporter permease [Atopobium fossor]|uniref:ABC transporter permease n=1 Tax=Atopobium fossor TaxID=39487 RepID=UPI000404695D|nr:ABC transporter permease [Atopobium fossor]
MRFRDLLIETFSALDSNRGRSLLTVLGIVIGIAAVIAMTAYIEGAKVGMVSQMGFNQARLVSIQVYSGHALNQNDLTKLKEQNPAFEFVTGISYGSSSISNGTKQINPSVIGCNAEYFTVMGLEALAGELILDSDVASSAMRVVIDKSIADKLFGSNEEAIGKTLHIDNDNYRVAGVVKSQMTQGDGMIYIPQTTFSSRMSGSKRIDAAYGLAREGTDMSEISHQTRNWLKSWLNLSEERAQDSIYVITMEETIKQLNAALGTFQLLMTAVASISLLVGGIGIMNMMITNVTERIHEIGLRKALGARAADITKQFLLESILICIVGGIFGIAIGYVGAMALGSFGGLFFGTDQAITPIIPPMAVVAATTTCVFIGILFGWWPARRAAKLDPIESLRYQ